MVFRRILSILAVLIFIYLLVPGAEGASTLINMAPVSAYIVNNSSTSAVAIVTMPQAVQDMNLSSAFSVSMTDNKTGNKIYDPVTNVSIEGGIGCNIEINLAYAINSEQSNVAVTYSCNYPLWYMFIGDFPSNISVINSFSVPATINNENILSYGLSEANIQKVVGGMNLNIICNVPVTSFNNSSPDGFLVTVNNENDPVTNVGTNNSNIIFLTLQNRYAETDTISVSYNFDSMSPNPIVSYSWSYPLESFNNQTPIEETPNPVLITSATTSSDGSSITITTDQNLNYIDTNSSCGFQVEEDGNVLHIGSVEVTGSSINIEIAGFDIEESQDVTITYTGNSINSSSSGSSLEIVDNYPVVDNSLQPASLSVLNGYVTTNGYQVNLILSGYTNLTSFSTQSGGFTVIVNGNPDQVTSANISGTILTLNLGSIIVANTNPIYVNYTPVAGSIMYATMYNSGSNSISSAYLQGFNNFVISNYSVVPANSFYATGGTLATNGLSITLNLNEQVTPGSVNNNASQSNYRGSQGGFYVYVNGVSQNISTTNFSGNQLTLIFSSPIQANKTIYLDWNTTGTSNVIVSMVSSMYPNIPPQVLTTITNMPITDDSSVAASFSITSAVVINSGMSIVAFCSDIPSNISYTDGAGFKINVNSNGIQIVSVTNSNSSYTISLVSPIYSGQSVVLSYIPSQNEPLNATDSASLAGFTNMQVNNMSSLSKPSTLVAISIAIQSSGLAAVVNLNQPAVLTSYNNSAGFTLIDNGNIDNINSINVEGSTVILNLNSVVLKGDTVSLTYSFNTNDPIVSLTGNYQLQNFSFMNAINNSSVSKVNPPVVNLTINNGASETTLQNVTLQINAVDSIYPQSELLMQVSNDDINWTGWEQYVSQIPWVLPSGNNSDTVYVQVKNPSGLVGSSSSAITLSNGSSSSGSSGGSSSGSGGSTNNSSGGSAINNTSIFYSTSGKLEQIYVDGNYQPAYVITNKIVTINLVVPGDSSSVSFSYDGTTFLNNLSVTPGTIFTRQVTLPISTQLNMFACLSDGNVYYITFVYDVSPPNFSIATINNIDACTIGSNVSLFISASDGSTLSQDLLYSYSINNSGFSSPVVIPSDGIISIPTLSSTGELNIVVKVYDQYGVYSVKNIALWSLNS